jgi:hypothetical protein
MWAGHVKAHPKNCQIGEDWNPAVTALIINGRETDNELMTGSGQGNKQEDGSVFVPRLMRC